MDQQLDETAMTSAKSHLDTALPELIRELGYTFTANVDQCRANLRQLGGGPDIHAATVARIIGVMVRTHTGLDDPTTLQNMNATGTSLWEKVSYSFLISQAITYSKIPNKRAGNK